jgi:hypothetical protein
MENEEEERYNITESLTKWKVNCIMLSESQTLDGTMTDEERIGEVKLLEEFTPVAETFKAYMLGPVGKDGVDVLMAKRKEIPNKAMLDDYDFSNCYLYYIGVAKVFDKASGEFRDSTYMRYAGEEKKVAHCTVDGKKYQIIENVETENGVSRVSFKVDIDGVVHDMSVTYTAMFNDEVKELRDILRVEFQAEIRKILKES